MKNKISFKFTKKNILILSIIAAVIVTTVVLVVVFTTMKKDTPVNPTNPTTPTQTSGSQSTPTSGSNVDPTTSDSGSTTSTSSTEDDGLYVITLNDGLTITTYRAAKIIVDDLPIVKRDGIIFRGWALSSTPDVIITEDLDIDSDTTLVINYDTIFTFESISSDQSFAIIDPANLNILNIKNINPYNYIYENIDDIVAINDNKLVIGDNGNLIINLDSDTGIVEVLFDLSIKTSDSNFVEINLDSNKRVELKVNEGLLSSNITDLKNEIAYNANTTYSFYFRIDISNNMVDVAINNKEFITGYVLESLTNVDSITIISSDVSNIAIKSEKKISNFIDYYSNELDKYVSAIDLTLYDENGKEITDIVENAKEELKALTTIDEIKEKYDNTITAIDNVKTTSQKAYEQALEDALNNYKEYLNDYTYEMLIEMKANGYVCDYDNKDSFITKFTADLENVTNLDELNELVNSYKDKADRYSDTNSAMISEYQNYKIDSLSAEFNMDNYTKKATEYENIFKSLGNDLIDLNPKTKAGIDECYTTARNKLILLKTDDDLLGEKKEEVLAQMHKYVEEDMKDAIVAVKELADGGDLDAEEAYDSLMEYVNESYDAINSAVNDNDLDGKYDTFKINVKDYVARGLKQKTQVKDARIEMFEEYKEKVLRALEGTDLYDRINAIVIEGIDDVSTLSIDEIIAKYEEAISKIDEIAYSDAKKAARLILEDYGKTEYEKLTYYKYYSDVSIGDMDSANKFRKTIENVLDNARYELIKATDDSLIPTIQEAQKTKIDEAIADIKNQTEFTISFVLKDAKTGNIISPREEFKVPESVTRVLNQTRIDLNYEEQFEADEGRPYAMVDGNKYFFTGYYIKYNSYSDREEYSQETPITGSFTLYLVWNNESLIS